MRVLFLTPQLPFPPQQGTQIRNYHLLRAAAAAHQVDLISFNREGESLAKAQPLLELCGQIKLVPAPPARGRGVRGRDMLTSLLPDLAHRLRSEVFAAALSSVAAGNRYDVIHVAGLEMAGCIPIAREAAPRAQVVFDDHNAEYRLQARAAAVDAGRISTLPRSAYSLVQWRRLRRYETWACRQADTVLAVSEADATALEGLGARSRILVVPNGVDADHYRPDPDRQPDPAGLLFTGTMDYRPNVDAMSWFVSDVLPLVAAQRPEVSLQIVGRSPDPAVLRLASANRNVTVTGAVEDVRPYFCRNSVFVVPIRMAGGARLKILEALAMGLPIVSTGLGAEGIDLAEGKEALLADTPDGFAEAVIRLLADRELRKQMSILGRQAAEERFHWSRVAPRLLEAYQDAETRGGGATRQDTQTEKDEQDGSK
ncbi:MAG: glycosyltransferase [Chloroflexota bacterium]